MMPAPITCRDPAQIRDTVRFFKARTRRPKHEANAYWDHPNNRLQRIGNSSVAAGTVYRGQGHKDRSKYVPAGQSCNIEPRHPVTARYVTPEQAGLN